MAEVAPAILVYVTLSGDDCHWYVTPVVVAPVKDNVKLVPEQTGLAVDAVVPPATGFTVTSTDVELADKPLGVQVTLQRK